jgi:hypothetical protein
MLEKLGGRLGGIAAAAVKFVEQAAGVVGWLASSITLGSLITAAGLGGWPSNTAIVRESGLLALWIGLLVVSIFVRRPRRWLAELGLRLGFYATLGFGALAIGIWLFMQDGVEATFVGGVSLTSAELGFALCAFSALRHREQVGDAWLKFRRYLNGAREDGSDRNCFECAGEPLAPFALLGIAAVGAFDPPAMADHISAVLSGFEADDLARMGRHVMAAWPVDVPPVLSTFLFWLGATGIFAVATYLALRRVGNGRAVRGFALWAYSLGEIGSGFALFAALLLQLDARMLGIRMGLVGIALAAVAAAWLCRRRRTLIVGRHGAGDPMFRR